MKPDTHPNYYPNAKVACACGNTWETGSTKPTLRVEICSNCNPFYTGKQKLVDVAGRVDKFKARQATAKPKPATKPSKTVKTASTPKTSVEDLEKLKEKLAQTPTPSK